MRIKGKPYLESLPGSAGSAGSAAKEMGLPGSPCDHQRGHFY